MEEAVRRPREPCRLLSRVTPLALLVSVSLRGRLLPGGRLDRAAMVPGVARLPRDIVAVSISVGPPPVPPLVPPVAGVVRCEVMCSRPAVWWLVSVLVCVAVEVVGASCRDFWPCTGMEGQRGTELTREGPEPASCGAGEGPDMQWWVGSGKWWTREQEGVGWQWVQQAAKYPVVRGGVVDARPGALL